MSLKRRIDAGAIVLAVCVLTVLVLRGQRQRANTHAGFQPAQMHDPRALFTEAERLALLGNWTKARPLFTAAERIYCQRGDERDALRGRIGRLRCDVERTSYAAGAHDISEQLKNPLVEHDARLRLECLTVKGVIDMNTNTAAARQDWREVLALAKSLGDRVWQARATGWLGLLAFVDGKIAQAGKMVTEAIIETSLLHDVGGEIDFLTFFGYGLSEYHRSEQALACFNRALKLAESTPDTGFPFHVYIGKVEALGESNRRQEAYALLDRALEEARRTDTLGAQADLLREGGELAEQDGDSGRAQSYYQECAFVSKQADLPRLLADSMFKLTNLYQQSGDLRKAEESVAQAIEAVRQVEAPYELPHYLAVEAELKRASGKSHEADTLFSEASDLVEGMLLTVSSSADESSLIGGMSEIYVGHFRLAAISLNDLEKAFRIVERARGRVMLDALRTRRAVPAEGLGEVTPTEMQVVSLQRELRQHHTSSERRELLDRLDEAEASLKHTEYERYRFRKFFPPDPVDLRKLRRSLRPDEMILEYVLADPESFCLTVTREAVRLSRLHGRNQIDALVSRYLTEIQNKGAGQEEAQQLYAYLVEPVAGGKPKRRLIVVPDGKLNALAFDSLVSPTSHYLLESHVITYSPSSTVFYLLRSLSQRSRPTLPFLGVSYDQDRSLPPQSGGVWGRVAVVVRGVFDLGEAELPPLPYARQEVTSIARLAGPRSILLVGSDATEEKLKSEPLQDFEVLHFAVHGIGNAMEPERSALVLGTSPISKEDGLWQAREIRREVLNAELVTLSGCDTGVGKPEGEEGVANLVRAFLLAGTRNVVASWWAADDRLTAALMTRFYEHLAQGVDESEALNRAKLDILAEFGTQTAPYYWAGFSLVGAGDSRPVFVGSK